MPTYYLLDPPEKDMVFAMRDGIDPLSAEDHEKIQESADMMFDRWCMTNRVRGQIVMPQESISYWVAEATYRYVLDKFGIKIK